MSEVKIIRMFVFLCTNLPSLELEELHCEIYY